MLAQKTAEIIALFNTHIAQLNHHPQIEHFKAITGATAGITEKEAKESHV